MERDILWAPWRMKYIRSLHSETDCFICDYVRNSSNDRENLVLWRSERALVMFNRFPYNNGHMLIAPNRHIADMTESTDAELLELSRMTRDVQLLLKAAINPAGFNVGMNFGRCAGAGLPGHMHIHVVPRWDGDTNFMAVTADTDIISQSLEELYNMLSDLRGSMNIPATTGQVE